MEVTDIDLLLVMLPIYSATHSIAEAIAELGYGKELDDKVAVQMLMEALENLDKGVKEIRHLINREVKVE